VSIVADVEIKGLEEAKKKLAKLSSKLNGAGMQQMMTDIGEVIRFDIEESFEREVSPFGEAWKPSNNGGKTLNDTGHLGRSFTINATPNSVTVGTNVAYAAIHQFGGIIAAKSSKGLRFKAGGKWVKKQSVTMPARPFFPIDENATIAPKTKKAIISTIEDTFKSL